MGDHAMGDASEHRLSYEAGSPRAHHDQIDPFFSAVAGMTSAGVPATSCMDADARFGRSETGADGLTTAFAGNERAQTKPAI